MIKALLFDFNGVVIDDEPIQMRVYQEILAEHGVVVTDADYADSHGMDDVTFVRAAFERGGQAVDAGKVLDISEAKTLKWQDTIADNIPLFPNVENFIRKAAKEFSLGIVSMAKMQEIEYVLERTGLAECFSVIVSAEDVDAPKPDPQCYRKGFRRIDLYRTSTGHSPMLQSDCVVIEDTAPGVASARAADLQVLGVTNTISDKDLRAAGARWIAKDLNDWYPESVRLAFA